MCGFANPSYDFSVWPIIDDKEETVGQNETSLRERFSYFTVA